MANILANWKTSVVGVFFFIAAVLGFLGVHIPGLAADPVALITAGIGFIVAKDAAVTGVK